jgi:hypothetical protein
MPQARAGHEHPTVDGPARPARPVDLRQRGQGTAVSAVQGCDDKIGEAVGEQDDGDAGEQDARDPVEDHARLR